jgi:hypothetical protein
MTSRTSAIPMIGRTSRNESAVPLLAAMWALGSSACSGSAAPVDAEHAPPDGSVTAAVLCPIIAPEMSEAFDRHRIEIWNFEGAVVRDSVVTGPPASLTLTPDAAAASAAHRSDFVAQITLLDGTSPVLRQTIEGAFEPGWTRSYRVPFEPACAAARRVCPAACSGGSCVDRLEPARVHDLAMPCALEGPRDGSVPARDGATPMPSGSICTEPAFASALLCDGFEEASSAWEEQSSGGLVELDDRVASRGRRSLHVRTTAASQYAAWMQPIPAQTSGDVYLRTMMRVAEGPPSAGQVNLVTLGQHRPDPVAVFTFNVGERGGAREIVHSYSSGTNLAYWSSSSSSLTRGAWLCLQMHIALSDSAGSIEIRVDGEVVVEQSGIDTLPPGGFASTTVGVGWSSLTDPIELYYDDFAVSRSPLPCE